MEGAVPLGPFLISWQAKTGLAARERSKWVNNYWFLPRVGLHFHVVFPHLLPRFSLAGGGAVGQPCHGRSYRIH